MENVAHSFVVVGMDMAEFPPRQYSTAFWEVSSGVVAGFVAGAVAAAYEALGSGEIEIHIIPITA